MSIELYCTEPTGSPESPRMPGISPTPSSPHITLIATTRVLSPSTWSTNSVPNGQSYLVVAFQLKSSRTFSPNVTDLDFWMYPFSSCSLRNFWSASSSSAIVGMILQSMALGAPSLSLMVWSHGLYGGNRWASSSLKTFQCFWYSFGISTLSWYCQVSWASLSDIVDFREHSSSRFPTIWTLSCSDRGSVMVRDMVSQFSQVSQSRDRMMIGR